MMSEKPPAGTIVFLKSGGPPLTVDEPTRTDEFIDIHWFNGAALIRDALHPNCITIHNPLVPRMIDPA